MGIKEQGECSVERVVLCLFAMVASWTNIFWLILICSLLAMILISVGCYLCKKCPTRSAEKQEKNSLERSDSVKTEVSICSVWTLDDGQEGRKELETDNTEGEASPPGLEDQISPPTSVQKLTS